MDGGGGGCGYAYVWICGYVDKCVCVCVRLFESEFVVIVNVLDVLVVKKNGEGERNAYSSSID